jgi:hypothetical protein
VNPEKDCNKTRIYCRDFVVEHVEILVSAALFFREMF